MASISETAGPIFTKILGWGIWFVIGIAILAILGGVGIWAAKKKKWNLRVEIKIPRSDGLIVNSEKAKGHFDVAEGVVSIKRSRLAPNEMKPFNVNKYVQGDKYLEVLQVGPDDFIPILPKSYTTIINTNAKDGEQKKFALLEIEGDLGSRRQWAFHASKNAKNRFTLKGFMDKYQFAIQMAIILFAIFIGFTALWSKVG